MTDKIWYDIPKIGSKTRGGWVYYGYVTSTMELDFELASLHKKGYLTKFRRKQRPDRFDIYYHKLKPTKEFRERYLK